ncbi:MAG: T9SS type A sorting domain-containing protein, partial [Bacteroidota bacterium]|nr:T9SS type A sorting domain-containing protein [Bacteroidota bacterium]
SPQTPTTAITPLYAEAHGSNGYMLEASITGFSSFYFAASNFVLPVELITFTGALQNNTALLEWKTANERNLSHFVVERSLDGFNFSGIGNVKASGVQSPHYYSLRDKELLSLGSAVVFYRLKMVDADNQFKYSNVITISIADRNAVVTVSPNPVNNAAQVSIKSAEDGMVQWKLVDNMGHTVQYNNVQMRKNNTNIISINMFSLAQGTYFLQVVGAGIDKQIKIQKL